MKLPLEIFPNPLLATAVEIRFTSKLNDETVLGAFFPHFSQTFPEVREGKVPKELRKDPQFLHSPDFIISNKEYSLSISKNLVLFENEGEYKLWGKYYPFICEQLKVLFSLDIVEKIQRIGIRYTSLFNGEFTLEKIINNLPKINLPGYTENIDHLRTDVKSVEKPEYRLRLEVIRNARGIRNNEEIIGAVIDIDASFSPSNEIKTEDVYSIIDELHLQEKKLFFSLLNTDFLATLNPKY